MKSNYHNELSAGCGERVAQSNSACSCEGPSGGFSGPGSGMSPGMEGPPVSVGVTEPQRQSISVPDPGTRSSWPYVSLPAARPECHRESTALNPSYTLPWGLSPISTSVLAVWPPSALPLLSLCSQTFPSRPLWPLHPHPVLRPLHPATLASYPCHQGSSGPGSFHYVGKALPSPRVTGWFQLTLWSQFMGNLLTEQTSQAPHPTSHSSHAS